MQLFVIEIIRAWIVIKKGHTVKEEKEELIPDYEHVLIMRLWTSDISEAHRKLGNTLMIRSRIRWAIFMTLVSGFYSMPILQIVLITLVQIVYCVHSYHELTDRKCFESVTKWLKHTLQEVSILIFLVILTLFQTINTQGFKNSRIYSVLEWFIIVGVILAIVAEFLTILQGVYDGVVDLLTKKNSDEKAKKEGIELIKMN